MLLFIIFLLIVPVLYLFFRKNPSAYFLLISFDWKEIYKVFELTPEDQKSFKINKDYFYESPNANNGIGLGIDSNSANFEYYITPNTLRNGSYQYSSIYDQHLKRFFETPNINYGTILSGKNKKNETVRIGCLFSTLVSEGNNTKVGFTIYFSKTVDEFDLIGSDSIRKALVIIFDRNFVNLRDAHNKWGANIPLTYYLQVWEKDLNKVTQKLELTENQVQVSTSLQSVNDAQSSPISVN